MAWKPPGKDCGLCGAASCTAFTALVAAGAKSFRDCPFYQENVKGKDSSYSGVDILGLTYDFVLHPFPGEPSTRKDIVPFRPDLVEKWEIKAVPREQNRLADRLANLAIDKGAGEEGKK